MRIQHVLSLLAVAAVPAFAFAAPASQDVADSAIATVPVVAGGASYKLRPFEFDGVQGTYALDDGRSLRVAAEHRRLYAEIGNEKAEIVAVAPNTFATRDLSMRLRFDQIPFATEVTLSTPAK